MKRPVRKCFSGKIPDQRTLSQLASWETWNIFQGISQRWFQKIVYASLENTHDYILQEKVKCKSNKPDLHAYKNHNYISCVGYKNTHCIKFNMKNFIL